MCHCDQLITCCLWDKLMGNATDIDSWAPQCDWLTVCTNKTRFSYRNSPAADEGDWWWRNESELYEKMAAGYRKRPDEHPWWRQQHRSSGACRADVTAARLEEPIYEHRQTKLKINPLHSRIMRKSKWLFENVCECYSPICPAAGILNSFQYGRSDTKGSGIVLKE